MNSQSSKVDAASSRVLEKRQDAASTIPALARPAADRTRNDGFRAVAVNMTAGKPSFLGLRLAWRDQRR
jgi:hypothetical protein